MSRIELNLGLCHGDYKNPESHYFQALRKTEFHGFFHGMSPNFSKEFHQFAEEQRKDYKQVIVVRGDLKVSRGKEIAQCCHASENSAKKSSHLAYSNWKQLCGERKITLKGEHEEQLREIYAEACAAGIPCHLVVDEGKTYFHGVHTVTALALGPHYAPELARLTGSLRLY